MEKENIKKYIAISMIFISSIIGIYHYYNNIHKTNLEKESAEVFIEETVKENKKVEKKKKESKTNNVINYIAVLEIPKINLKRGLVDPSSSSNNVGENIQILNPTSMPNEDNHTFILAAHSGSSQVAYFDDLNKLSNGDNVYVYYKNIKYIYKITNNYSEKKTGSIVIKKDSDESVIVLTSCSKSNTKQLVYTGKLIGKESYSE